MLVMNCDSCDASVPKDESCVRGWGRLEAYLDKKRYEAKRDLCPECLVSVISSIPILKKFHGAISEEPESHVSTEEPPK